MLTNIIILLWTWIFLFLSIHSWWLVTSFDSCLGCVNRFLLLLYNCTSAIELLSVRLSIIQLLGLISLLHIWLKRFKSLRITIWWWFPCMYLLRCYIKSCSIWCSYHDTVINFIKMLASWDNITIFVNWNYRVLSSCSKLI